MPRKNTYIPIESYDPRLKALLIQGAKERVVLPCESASQRYALRNQLLNYRARAKEAKLPEVHTLYRTKVTLEPKTPEGKYPLVLAPRGSEFNAVLGSVQTSPAAPSSETDILSDIPVTPLEKEEK